jgi:hypothetical protein
MSRFTGVLVAAVLATCAALWLLPPVGFVAAMVLLVILPPWGRSLAERAVISGVTMLGLIAVLFPRAGSTPVTSTSAHALLTLVLLLLLAARFVPRFRDVAIPRPTWTDGIIAGLAIVSGWWLMAAYIGRSTYEIVSGLFFSGWDNHAHFTTFANTYVANSTTWPTVDGSIAWNQWYPALHSTLMSLAELAAHPMAVPLSRPDLLWPFVQWNAISFALCLAALAWVAGDLAARLGGRERESWTRPIATAGFAAFALLGSPALLFNRGFTNFAMGVTVVVVVGYLSSRSWKSARVLGWFLVPLAAISAIGLWTPLVLGLVPAGIVVAIALLKHRRWMGIAWLVAAAAVGVVLALTQMQAILGVDSKQGAGDFAQTLGSVEVGMSAFNAGTALAAPIVAVLLAVLLVQRRSWPMPIAVLGPILGFALVAGVFMLATDSAETSRLQSYYVLKPLNAMLLAVAPLIGALLAVAVARAVQGMRTSTAVVSVLLAATVVIALFGYSGQTPANGADGLKVAPGVQAGADRTFGVSNPLIGEVIIRSRDAAEPFPQDGTFVWDGAGTLPNLWVASLHGTLSRDQQTFLLSLPAEPYDDKTLAYVDFTLSAHPQLRLAVMWFRPASGDVLTPWAAGKQRVDLVQVPMPANGACPDCSQ